MTVMLALGAAAFYGAGDFMGGLAARRNAVLIVALGAQIAGLVVLAMLLPFLGTAAVQTADLVAGGAAGIFGGLGLAVAFRALAIGPMSIVAPTTALSASAVPVLAGLAMGERPGTGAFAGIAVSFAAIALITREPASSVRPGGRPYRAMLMALGGGTIFGCFFICLHQADAAAGLWPLLPARLSAIAMLAALVVKTRSPITGGMGLIAAVALSGALDMTANVLYLLASQQGLLAVVAALTGLYPASTVLLAQTRLGERLAPLQSVGLGVAVLAAVLVAA